METPSQSYGTSLANCHVGSHGVTCHPTQVNAPRLTPASAGCGTRFTYAGGMVG